MRTLLGEPCPYHPEERTEFVALYPMKDGIRLPEAVSGPGVIEAHDHAIGRTAYLEQFAEMFPESPLPELRPLIRDPRLAEIDAQVVAEGAGAAVE